MTITLPEYRAAISNQVYFKPIMINGGASREILIFTRIHVPTKEEVFSYSATELKKWESTADCYVPGAQIEGCDEFEQELITLPAVLRRGVLSKDKDIVKLFRESIPLADIPIAKAKHTVYARCGIFPYRVIKQRISGSAVDINFYLSLLDDEGIIQEYGAEFGESLTLGVTLEEGMKLPLRKTLDTLVDTRCSCSDVLNVNPEGYNKKIARKLVDLVYSGLRTKSDITTIFDLSKEAIRQFSVIGLRAFCQEAVANGLLKEEDIRKPVASIHSSNGNGKKVLLS